MDTIAGGFESIQWMDDPPTEMKQAKFNMLVYDRQRQGSEDERRIGRDKAVKMKGGLTKSESKEIQEEMIINLRK